MNILISNDDGIYAEGLWALAQELKPIGNVLVVAPDREQSGIGTAVTLNHPVKFSEIRPLISGIETYAIEGTPSDSVILALKLIARGRVDMVCSGINKGTNLGYDVVISGTLGAAFQGYFDQRPSIAISTAYNQQSQFGIAARLARLLVERLQATPAASPLLLNVNIPDLPLEEIKGIELTRLGLRSYEERIQSRRVGGARYHWILRDKLYRDEEPERGTDIWALRNGSISVTPLHSDLSGSRPAHLEELCRSLFLALRRLP